MKEPNNELFFVQVREPNLVRKDILQALKGIVEVLHRFEKFKQIRHEKTTSINKLSSLLKEANKMLGSLKLKLPQTNLKAAVAVAVKENAEHSKKSSHNKKGKDAQEKPDKGKKEMTELEKLEAQLSAIESKLKTLT